MTCREETLAYAREALAEVRLARATAGDAAARREHWSEDAVVRRHATLYEALDRVVHLIDREQADRDRPLPATAGTSPTPEEVRRS